MHFVAGDDCRFSSNAKIRSSLVRHVKNAPLDRIEVVLSSRIFVLGNTGDDIDRAIAKRTKKKNPSFPRLIPKTPKSLKAESNRLKQILKNDEGA